MKTTYNEAEIEAIIFDALCNGLGELGGCGIVLEVDNDQYNQAREFLKNSPEVKFTNKQICLEDVYMQILKTDKLKFVDDEDGEFEEVTFEQAMERINNCSEDFAEYPMNCHKEQGDAWDACNTLQIMIYNDVPFG